MIKKLGEICLFTSGFAWKAAEFTDEGVPIIRINNMQPNSNEFVYWKGDYDKRYLIRKGDILISLSGTIKTYRWDGPEGLLNQRIAKISVIDDVDKNWIYYQITHVIEQIANKAKHAVIKNVSLDEVRSFEINLPDLELQNKIVSILDKASLLLKRRADSLRTLNNLLNAIFLEMFGSKNPDFKKWAEIEIYKCVKNENGSLRSGPFGSHLKHDEFTEEGEVAVLGIDNAVNNEFRWGKRRYITLERYKKSFLRYTVYPRDVIITIMGTVGRSAVIPSDIPLAINTKHLACITLDETKCNPYYLAYSIHSNPFIAFQMKSLNRGVIMDGLNLDIIKNLKLKKAPINLQNHFEKVYLEIEAKYKNLKLSESNIKNLYDSIIQRAFSGKLRLNISAELDALLMEIDVKKADNDLYSIITNEEYLQNLVFRLNNQRFESQETYDKAKHTAFQLLKEDQSISQELDKKTQSIKLLLK